MWAVSYVVGEVGHSLNSFLTRGYTGENRVVKKAHSYAYWEALSAEKEGALYIPLKGVLKAFGGEFIEYGKGVSNRVLLCRKIVALGLQLDLVVFGFSQENVYSSQVISGHGRSLVQFKGFEMVSMLSFVGGNRPFVTELPQGIELEDIHYLLKQMSK